MRFDENGMECNKRRRERRFSSRRDMSSCSLERELQQLTGAKIGTSLGQLGVGRASLANQALKDDLQTKTRRLDLVASSGKRAQNLDPWPWGGVQCAPGLVGVGLVIHSWE